MSKPRPTAISIFSGALGLDLGLERAGFDVRVAIECNRFAVETIKTNRPNIHVFPHGVEDVPTPAILKAARLKVGEPTLVVGGLCCQSFSTAGQRGSVADPRGKLILEFLRVVRESRPRFFVIENVRGMLSAAIQHRPLAKRGPGYRQLTAKEELGSAFRHVLMLLRRLGYYTVFDLVNAADFGVPQSRERLLIIGSRDGEDIAMPESTHSAAPRDGLLPWVTLREALAGLRQGEPEIIDLPPAWAKYLKHVPTGGNWRDLPDHLKATALGSAFRSWGGRSGFYRRLSWDKPSPSLTTRPSSKATLLCHPTELRPLSVAEYARIQQFPDNWKFAGGTPQKYKQIGNAVPVGLGHAIGQALCKTMARKKARGEARSGISCPNKVLLDRLADRPRTILNPPRMRRYKTVAAMRKWANGALEGRGALLVPRGQRTDHRSLDRVSRATVKRGRRGVKRGIPRGAA